jgi:hypothetical protein
MNATPSKVFTVIVLNCENLSHARKIAELLRASFPHRSEHTQTDEPINLTVMVKADSLDSIRSVVSPALGKARPVFAEYSYWFSDEGQTSEPPAHIQFVPPTRLRSLPTPGSSRR